MTAPDASVPHILTAPARTPFSGLWTGRCSCGTAFSGGTDSEVRTAGQPHRDAERARLGTAPDRERAEARRLRREARRGQVRSRVDGSRGRSRGMRE